jgi:hypothetical protein
MRGLRRTTRAAVLLLALAPAACDLKPAVAPVVETDPLAGLGPGIHPVLVVAERGPESTRVELYLKRVQVSAEVASFQGELRYPAGSMKPAAVEFAPGTAGAWNEAAPGRLRFAAAAPGGVGDGPVLTLRFTGQSALTRESFTLAMEEVVARDGFANVTRLVAAAAHPLLVRGAHAREP